MRNNHMTRPIKIRIALALVVLGALAWAVWPGEEVGAVSLTFAGVSTTNSHLLLFTITNGSKKSFAYGMAVERQTNGVWPGTQLELLTISGPLELKGNGSGRVVYRITREWCDQRDPET